MHRTGDEEGQGSDTAILPHAVSFDNIDWIRVVFDAHSKKCSWTAQCISSSNSTFTTTILENVTRNGTAERKRQKEGVR